MIDTICTAGNLGPGGTCNCSQVIGWKEGEWSGPWCHEGECYIGQEYAECQGKDYSIKDSYSLGDRTWCFKGKRNNRCPSFPGYPSVKRNPYENNITCIIIKYSLGPHVFESIFHLE